jgi:hypothetical protein
MDRLQKKRYIVVQMVSSHLHLEFTEQMFHLEPAASTRSGRLQLRVVGDRCCFVCFLLKKT